MNRAELKARLEEERIDPRFYSIRGLTRPPIAEQGVLGKDGDNWVVHYFERGRRNNLMVFESVDQACRYFLEWVLSLPELRLKQP